MGQWRYADDTGRYQGERAIELAIAAPGKRNLFHDDVLLRLENRDRPLNLPPLVAERRLRLSVIANGWPHLVGADENAWLSDPIPLLAARRRWVWRRRINETTTRAVARTLFARVHEELHAAADRRTQVEQREAACR